MWWEANKTIPSKTLSMYEYKATHPEIHVKLRLEIASLTVFFSFETTPSHTENSAPLWPGKSWKTKTFTDHTRIYYKTCIFSQHAQHETCTSHIASSAKSACVYLTTWLLRHTAFPVSFLLHNWHFILTVTREIPTYNKLVGRGNRRNNKQMQATYDGSIRRVKQCRESLLREAIAPNWCIFIA